MFGILLLSGSKMNRFSGFLTRDKPTYNDITAANGKNTPFSSQCPRERMFDSGTYLCGGQMKLTGNYSLLNDNCKSVGIMGIRGI